MEEKFGRQLFLTSADPLVQSQLQLNQEDVIAEIKSKSIFGTPIVVAGSWAVRSTVTISALQNVEPLIESGLLYIHQRDDISSYLDYVDSIRHRLQIGQEDAENGARYLDSHSRSTIRFHAKDMSQIHFKNIAAALIRDKVNGLVSAEWDEISRFIEKLFGSTETNRESLFHLAGQFIRDCARIRRYIQCSYFIIGASASESLPLFQDRWIPETPIRLATTAQGSQIDTAFHLLEQYNLMDYEMKSPQGEGQQRFSDSIYMSMLEFRGLDAVVSQLSPDAVCKIARSAEAKAVHKRLAAVFADINENALDVERDSVREAIGMSIWNEFEKIVKETAKRENEDRSNIRRNVGRLRTAALAGGALGVGLAISGVPIPVIGICTFLVSLGTFIDTKIAEKKTYPIYTFVEKIRSSSRT